MPIYLLPEAAAREEDNSRERRIIPERRQLGGGWKGEDASFDACTRNEATGWIVFALLNPPDAIRALVQEERALTEGRAATAFLCRRTWRVFFLPLPGKRSTCSRIALHYSYRPTRTCSFGANSSPFFCSPQPADINTAIGHSRRLIRCPRCVEQPATHSSFHQDSSGREL